MTLAAIGLALLAAAPPVVSVTVDGGGPEAARYLAIDVGRPLDPAQVRRTVELLHATGAYEDVVVEEADVPGGSAVTVRLFPAPLLTSVVVEGDAVISPDDARDAARLRVGEALWPQRLEAAGRDVALALGRRGYLEARVTATAQREAVGRAAVFTVAAGPRVIVERTEVDVKEHGLARRLDFRVEPDAGEPFDRDRAQQAAEEMRQKLVELGRWRAAVTVTEEYDPANARIRLTFHAEPGPVMSVRFTDGAVSSGTPARVRATVRDGGAGTDAIEQARDILEADLRREGYRKARVTPSEDAGRGRIDIVYRVDAGPLSRVASIRIEPEVPDLPPSIVLRTRAAEPVREGDLTEDERTLARALVEAGHPDASVEADAEGEGSVPVVFHVSAGPAVAVASVEIAGPTPSEARGAHELRLRVGRPYRLADVAADRAALTLAYRNDGYLSADVTPEITVTGGEARIRFAVATGPRTVVDRIVVAGLDQTREDVVRRELRVREGEPLGVDDLLETQRRLTALGVFEAVTIVELAAETPGRRTLVIRVDEAPRTAVAYGIGYGERDLVRGSVEVTRRNLFGMDRRLNAFVRMSFRGSRLLASFREPYLLGRKQELFVIAFRDEEDREAFDYTREGITVQTARAISGHFNLVLRETFQQIHTFNVVEDCLALDRQFCPSTISGPAASLLSDTRDDPLDPHRGYFLLTDAQLSLGALGGDPLVKAFVQASGYRRIAPRVILALSGRLGAGRTFGDEPLLLPVPERFFAGGDYSLRGFGVDEVRPEGGNGVLLGTAEVRFDAGKGISLAAFSDVGNVYLLASDITFSDLRYTAGAGVRYRSALGPLRLDWAFKLDRRPDESASHLHVTIGHAF